MQSSSFPPGVPDGEKTSSAGIMESVPDAAGAPERILGWGLFWRLLMSQAGALFCVAALICFFAYNWAGMPAFVKFGLIAGLMAASGALALVRGAFSTVGGLGLLGCGLLAGVLLAVYGQVYQTGANAWELFRAWTLFLLPLALLGRQAGLWFALWLVGTLWAALYLKQYVNVTGHSGSAEKFVFLVVLGQTAFFALWEVAARFFATPGRPFLYARWLPRCIGFLLVIFLALVVCASFFEYSHVLYRGAYRGLFLALLVGGAFWYTRMTHDLFMIGSGLLAILTVLLSLLISVMGEKLFDPNVFFLIALGLLTGAVLAGKLLIRLHNERRAAAGQPEEIPDIDVQSRRETPGASVSAPFRLLPEGFSSQLMRFILQGKRVAQTIRQTGEAPSPQDAESSGKSPWVARLFLGLCAWVSVPFILGCIGLLFADAFSGEGFIFLPLSLILLGAGLAFSSVPGVFAGQMALCLCLAGALGASIITPLVYQGHALFVPGILVFAVSGILSRSMAYRFIALTFACTLAFFQAAILPGAWGAFEEHALYRYHIVTPGWVFAAVSAVLSLWLAWFWPVRGLSALWRSLQMSLLTTFLLICLSPLLLHVEKLWVEAGLWGYGAVFWRMAGMGAGAGLFAFAYRISRELVLPKAVTLGAYVMCTLVVALSYYRMPWLGVGFLTLALARQAGSLPLLGVGICYLAVCTVAEYYYLASSLLHKSYTLGGIGAALCLAAMLLHRRLAGAVQAGELPAPAAVAGIAPSSLPPLPGVACGKEPYRVLLALCLIGFFLLFGWSVRQKEDVLHNGRRVVLALRPVDPRSLMQGDYMALSLDIEQDIAKALTEPVLAGLVWAVPDTDGVYRFAGLGDAPVGGDAASAVRLLYRGKPRGVGVGSRSFFFQEGHGDAYEMARFVEMRVDDAGNALTTHLLDGSLQRIEPARPAGKF